MLINQLVHFCVPPSPRPQHLTHSHLLCLVLHTRPKRSTEADSQMGLDPQRPTTVYPALLWC